MYKSINRKLTENLYYNFPRNTYNSPGILIILSFVVLLSITGCSVSKKLVSVIHSGDQKILELINKARENGRYCGDKYFPAAGKLEMNDVLTRTAKKHSIDMSENGFFDHKGSNGFFAGERAAREGYDWRICGENILFGERREEKVIVRWLESESHCKIIMEEKFEDMGVSRVKGKYKGKDSYFWTLVMAAKK